MIKILRNKKKIFILLPKSVENLVLKCLNKNKFVYIILAKLKINIVKAMILEQNF